MRIPVVLVALTLAVSGCAAKAAPQNEDQAAVAVHCPGAACSKGSEVGGLSDATERLLAASRAGEIPTITFVRNSLDATGLIVAVPHATLGRFGAARLSQIYSGLVGLPTSIDVAELPNDGLPIKPTATTK